METVYISMFMTLLSCVQSDIVLTQKSNEVKKPGESLRLTCHGSGQDSDGDTVTAYPLSWIRQEPGKGLEWLALISSDSSTTKYASSVEGQFTISRDNSKQALYLDVNSLKIEDTATYFCAVGTMSNVLWSLIQNPQKSLFCPLPPPQKNKLKLVHFPTN
uniref:Ig-like domain-containing protein n=1 Tax=Erpetoichthys calabaricus TaxID=27687 RepID=A0A8C4XEC0_ERPCA